ncbi:MAG: hypothetical protein R3247_01380 [Rhodothermales bacterium]|nr:hypothetical protein [Rhodothermales bacterium]
MPQAVDMTWTVGDDGHLPRAARRFLAAQLKLYAGGEVRIRLSRPKRTTKANAYYWAAVIQPIRAALLEAGQVASAEDVHELFKARYLAPRVAEVFGEAHVLSGSTAELDQTAFFEYVEAIRTDEDVLALGVFVEDAPESLRSHRISDPF